MKEGDEFYIKEGSDYNMVTRWLPRRFCFYNKDKMEMVGQELIQIKQGEVLS